MKERVIRFTMERPKAIIAAMVVLTLLMGAMMTRVTVDTDPENMLSETEAARVFHNRVKKEFGLHDVVVLGVVNEEDPDGVFNPETLARVHELTVFASSLSHPDHPEKKVVARDIIAPGTVDAILQAGPGEVRFQWLMKTPPESREAALRIRELAMGNPLLRGTMASEDGKALAIYLPITEKDFAFRVRKELLEKIAEFEGDERYYITGLPVAEDTFGVEMFIQMAISAPLAMVAIFILMLIFFRNFRMVISPMVVAMVSVICTMGLLIGTGNTVHIMSSMIPIFLMPIAVVDSIHILSEFFDRYRAAGDKQTALAEVMDHLFSPMLYTSLTSTAGFASLALTPIPPVRVFGIFVAFGIMLAWLVTILFIPAYITLMGEDDLEKMKTFGDAGNSLLSRYLKSMGGFTLRRYGSILAFTAAALMVAGWGISRIEINDNPVKWFKKDHEIRVADRVLNSHFGGTYEAYLVLEGAAGPSDPAAEAEAVNSALAEVLSGTPLLSMAEEMVEGAGKAGETIPLFYASLTERIETAMDDAPDDEYFLWEDAISAMEAVRNRGEIFKRPDLLNYIAALQADMAGDASVGKSNSVADLVKKVHMELLEGDPSAFRIPDTVAAVAQTLISFQNSHKPDDLYHLVTPDYSGANLWVQLREGDNSVMEATVKRVETFMAKNPPPVPITANWAGLTYINVVWQEKMVTGMLKSFMSSFVVVFLMMALLFRSPLWGLVAMVPLSVTIAVIYGIIGIVGKDYDMPVAVLSSLTLGLAVDFAIHFLERSRSAHRRWGSWREAVTEMFEEPARAISRNVIVVAVGFTPLLLAPLIPYRTVGVFLASIMAVSGIATMVLLPAIIAPLEGVLFGKEKGAAPASVEETI